MYSLTLFCLLFACVKVVGFYKYSGLPSGLWKDEGECCSSMSSLGREWMKEKPSLQFTHWNCCEINSLFHEERCLCTMNCSEECEVGTRLCIECRGTGRRTNIVAVFWFLVIWENGIQVFFWAQKSFMQLWNLQCIARLFKKIFKLMVDSSWELLVYSQH